MSGGLEMCIRDRSGFLGANVGPNTVADETDFKKGTWDFDLQFSFNLNGPLAAQAGAERISFADALEKQLGLKLDKREVPVPVIVIDGVNQTPTPNSPDMKLHLPALPTEFEVAAIKPTPPDFRFGSFQPQRGGRVVIQGLTLDNRDANRPQHCRSIPLWRIPQLNAKC